MGDLFSWLFSFFFLILLLVILGYQLMLLTDLEFDYINPYDSASRINKVVLPEYVTQGILCFIYLVVGHWFLFLLSLPYLYYNIRLYTQKQHLVDVTEIYNQLSWHKTQRIYKFGHIIIILCGSIFWTIWNFRDEM